MMELRDPARDVVDDDCDEDDDDDDDDDDDGVFAYGNYTWYNCSTGQFPATSFAMQK